jgi:hypothetical protein
MTGARTSTLMIGAMLLVACGSSDGTRVAPEIEKATEERSSNYAVTNVEGTTPCGWLEIPNGGTEYVPCTSEGLRSPISDSPETDDEWMGPPAGFDPRPEPPGDPPWHR